MQPSLGRMLSAMPQRQAPGPESPRGTDRAELGMGMAFPGLSPPLVGAKSLLQVRAWRLSGPSALGCALRKSVARNPEVH